MTRDIKSKTVTLECLLQSNPKAARHGASIKEALKAVRELREAGVSSDGNGYLPVGGRRSVSEAPRPTNRKIMRSSGKLTFNAGQA